MILWGKDGDVIKDERMRGDRWIVVRGGQGESRIMMRKNSEADMMRGG